MKKYITTKKKHYKIKNKSSKKQKERLGGMRFNDDYKIYPKNTENSVLIEYFIKNSTFEILTNSSISCLTIIASLKIGIISPFKSIRSNDLDLEIRKILIKIMISNPLLKQTFFLTKKGRKMGKNIEGIEIQSLNSFISEIKIQRDIYDKSFISKYSLLDAICPNIIDFQINIKSEIFDFICDKLPSNDRIQMEYIRNVTIQTEYFKSNNPVIKMIKKCLKNKMNYKIDIPNDNYQISAIFMEFMQDYGISYKTIECEKIAQFEFMRLNNELGYFHGDSHSGNYLYNPKYEYFMDDNRKIIKGKIIIIDFGRTQPSYKNSYFEEKIYKRLNEMDPNYHLNMIELKTYKINRIRYVKEKTIPEVYRISETPMPTNSCIDKITSVFNSATKIGNLNKIQTILSNIERIQIGGSVFNSIEQHCKLNPKSLNPKLSKEYSIRDNLDIKINDLENIIKENNLILDRSIEIKRSNELFTTLNYIEANNINIEDIQDIQDIQDNEPKLQEKNMLTIPTEEEQTELKNW